MRRADASPSPNTSFGTKPSSPPWTSPHPPLTLPFSLHTPHIIRYPVTKAAIADPLTRYWVPNTDAVFWWSLESPIAGRILHTHVWLHSHRARFGGLLFVSGQHSPDSLASIGPSCIVGSKSAGRRTADEGASAACTDLMEVRRRLYAAAESRGILICADDDIYRC